MLGQGTFGTVRVAVHRASGEAAAVKVLSRSGLERQCDAAKAVAREREVMLKVQRLLPAHAPLVSPSAHSAWLPCSSPLFFSHV